MGTIKVHEFMTLDGGIGAPMWTLDYPFTDQMSASVGALTASSEVILLGRTTWEQTGPAWSSRTEEEMPGSDLFNNTPKWVVSGTLQDASSWRHSSVVGGYDPEALRTLKATVDGGIYCYGSGTLVRAMIADGLVDELHLYTYPVAGVEGPKLFPEGTAPTTLRLVAAEAIDNGVAHLHFGPAA